MQLCRLAPPGTNPSALASYSPWISPMNSFMKVAMEPRRTKRMLGDHPSRRKNYEVDIRGSRNFRRRSQHRVNRRIRMIEAHGVDAIEIRQIVLVGHVVPMPGNHVQRRVIDRRRPESSLELGHNPVIALSIFKRRYRSQKVARIRQTVRANRYPDPADEAARRSSRRCTRALPFRRSSTRKRIPR